MKPKLNSYEKINKMTKPLAKLIKEKEDTKGPYQKSEITATDSRDSKG